MAGPSPDHGYRLSDDERDEALEGLRKALEEGRLDLAEHESRSDAALRSVTSADLLPLFADLPEHLRPAPITAAPRGTVAEKGAKAPAERTGPKGRGVNIGGLAGWGGFLLFVWGLPTLISGNVTGFLVFLGFFCMLVVGPAVGQYLRNRREGGRDSIESG
ncbi:DUF1707 SHOCT-like domain-containing protein [Nocardiopsis sp. LOL_012]|uniref:DUF1707 SHOCT-like domain-containing protein n=1 Tax=Nocardiopsis sp. LOL_012 TaxID=3345409 RepID=UPI003A8593AC